MSTEENTNYIDNATKIRLQEEKFLASLEPEDAALYAYLLGAWEDNHPSDEYDDEETTTEETTSSNPFSPQTNEDYYADIRHQEEYDNS